MVQPSSPYRYRRPVLRNGMDEALVYLERIANADAFGRVRVAQPFTLFDSKQIFDNAPLFWDDADVSGVSPVTSSSSHSVATASSTLSVAATSEGRRVRQTFQRFNYQPGKSLLVLQTGRLVASGGGSGIASRIGYFDDDNGLFWAYEDGVLKVVVRSSASGSPVDTEITQEEFNGDRLNGRDRSQVTIDLTKEQIFWVDFEWLGVGSVRFGVVVDGQFILAHQVNNANALGVVYMSTPNLPLRYEISNDGTGQASSMEHVCATVISEGGFDPGGTLFSDTTAPTHVDANTADAVHAILGLRLKSTHLGATVDLTEMSMLAETSTDFEWSLLFNPTVAGTFTYSDITNSACQIAKGATANTITGGLRLNGGLVKSGNTTGNITQALNNAIRLGAALDGTRDTMVLACRPLSSNADIQGSLSWRELG